MKNTKTNMWPRHPLGEVCEINPPRDRELNATEDTEVTFVPMPAVNEFSGSITKPILRRFAEVKKGYTYFRSGDVIFAKITPCMQNGKHAVVGSLAAGFGFGSTEFHVLRAGPSLTSDWIHRFLRQPRILESFSEEMTGAVGQQRLPAGLLAKLEIPLPPPVQQRTIVARLDAQLAATTRARGAVAAQLADAERVIQRWIDERFAAIAKKRAVRRLDAAAEIQAGVTLGKDYPPSETVSVPYLRVANVKDGRLDLADVKSIAVPPQMTEKLALRFGDMLLTEGGDPDKVGRGTLWQNELPMCIHQNHIFRVRFDLTQFDPTFLALQFRCAYAKAYFLAHAKQTTGIASINQQVLRAYPLLHVPLTEQRAMVAAYTKLNEQSARALIALSQQLADLDRLPAALLREAFAG